MTTLDDDAFVLLRVCVDTNKSDFEFSFPRSSIEICVVRAVVVQVKTAMKVGEIAQTNNVCPES
jgi:hypothetical protein